MFPTFNQIPVTHETCPACNNTIQPAHLFRNLRPKDDASELLITVWCDCCERVWRRSFVFTAGTWRAKDGVREITDAKTTTAIRRKVDQANGVMQAVCA